MTLYLRIAGLVLQIQGAVALTVPERFRPFLTEPTTPDEQLILRPCTTLPQLPAAVYEDRCYRVHPWAGGFLRSFFDAPRTTDPYAVATRQGRCLYLDHLPSEERLVRDLDNCIFYLGLEEVLLRNERLCLHAACVRTGLGGLLFCGPSGAGKTTQAQLWCRHRGAQMLNGDRPILQPEEALAWGSPYAGSSRCHINEHCKIRAIMLPVKSHRCAMTRLSEAQAFRALWGLVTVPVWDPQAADQAFRLVSRLVQDLPVYELECTPRPEAVETVERELMKWTDPTPGH